MLMPSSLAFILTLIWGLVGQVGVSFADSGLAISMRGLNGTSRLLNPQRRWSLLINLVLFASSVVILALIYFLSREMRMRRALQLLIAKLLTHWRNQKPNE